MALNHGFAPHLTIEAITYVFDMKLVSNNGFSTTTCNFLTRKDQNFARTTYEQTTYVLQAVVHVVRKESAIHNPTRQHLGRFLDRLDKLIRLMAHGEMSKFFRVSDLGERGSEDVDSRGAKKKK